MLSKGCPFPTPSLPEFTACPLSDFFPSKIDHNGPSIETCSAALGPTSGIVPAGNHLSAPSSKCQWLTGSWYEKVLKSWKEKPLLLLCCMV